MRKVLNVITLIVMMSVNVMNPFTYAISLWDDFEEIQNFDEIMQEDDNFDDEEKIDDEENNEISYIEQENDDNSDENTENLSENDEDLLVEQLEWENNIQDNSLESQDDWDITKEIFENSDDILVESQDEEVQTELTGDNLEIDIVKESVDDISQNLVDAWEFLNWDVEELIWADLELTTARETVNVEPIIEVWRWNNVTVNVEAPAGTFPEGTYANIRPIVSTTKLDEIKGQISEEDETVSQESEIVAFDITFMYKLSDDTEVEVQPKENTVKVTFNYEDNDELSKADEIDEQEVKVFHIEEVKDEQWNKTWEEKVNDVTNKEESVENGIAVADAESFSIYALTVTVGSDTYTLTLDPQWGTFVADPNITITCDQEHDTHCNGTITVDASGVAKEPRFPNKDGYMFLWWFDAASWGNRFEFEGNPITSNKILYAHWAEYEKLNLWWEVNGELITITMMDRNLWAENENHLGYYYQWWNNHGFSVSSNTINPSSSIITQRANVSWYSWSNPFYSKYFIKNDGWMSSNNKDLWWWANDDISNYYDDWDYRYKRQWPCPTWYHVPSVKEWFEVVDIFLQKYDIPELTRGGFKYPNQVWVNPWSSSPGGGFNSVKYSLGDNYDSIIDSLGITYNWRIGRSDGKRNRNEGNSDKDPRSYLWTSSLKTSNDKEAFVIEFWGNDKVVSVWWFSENNAMGFWVRCFKDESDVRVVKFELNGWTWDSSNPKYLTYDKEQGIVLPSEEPELYAYNFDGWYTSEDDGITFDDKVEDGDKVWNVVLYAKYTHKPTYQINFVIEWVSYSQYLMEWEIPSYDGIPTKPDQDEFSYRFDGWSDGTRKYELDEELPAVTGPATYTAVFDPYISGKYKVTYDIDGDGHEDNVQYVLPDEVITLSVAPTKEWYDFAGWKAANEENAREAESEYTVIADVDFTAQWTPTEYSIVYDYSGWSVSSQNPTTYDVENNEKTINSPTKSGRKFVWWKEYVCNETNINNCESRTRVKDVLAYGNSTSIEIDGIWHKKFEAQWTENEETHTVIWLKDNDFIHPVKISQEAQGTPVLSIKPENPTKEADAQYTYSFVGWMKGNSENIITNWEAEMVTDFVIYRAKFDKTVNQYSVTFYDEDETTVLQESTLYNYGSWGADIVIPAAPDKVWYHFDGWLKKTGDNPYSSDVVNMDTEVIIEDTIYKAKYSPIINEYTITFVLWNGDSDVVITGHEWDSVVAPTGFTKNGYTFNGWNQNVPSTIPAQNLTITATWTPIIYNIIYTGVEEGYLGTGTYTIEDTFTIPNPENKVWYSFKGWREYVNMAENGEDPDWQEPNPWQIYYNSDGITKQVWNIWDRKYVAQWEVEKYTIFWIDENLHILETDYKNVPYGTLPSYDKENNPSKQDTAEWHYEFIGWKTAWSDSVYNKVANPEKWVVVFPVVTWDTIYKAEYLKTKRQYTITFINDNDSELSSEEYNYGTAATDIVQPVATKTPTAQYTYTFARWDPALAEVTWTQTYKATYNSILRQYAVTFVDEDESTLQIATMFDYDSHPIYNGSTPTKQIDDGYNYQFDGWVKKVWDGDFGTDVISDLTTEEIRDTTIYKAHYTRNPFTYSVTLNPNGEWSVDPSIIIVTYGSRYGNYGGESHENLPEPTRDGYDFVEWNTQADWQWTTISASTSVWLSAINQILYAQWTPSDYDLEFVDDDEITPLIPQTTYTIEDTTTLSIPTKPGYTFIGWKEYVDGIYTRAYLASDLPITLPIWNIWDRKYVAQWNLNWHVVIWLDDDGRILDIDTNVPDETLVTSIAPDDPTKIQDDQYTYTFDKWLKEIISWNPTTVSDWTHETVTQDVKYQASYTSTLRYYNVTFKDEDENIIQVDGRDSNSYGYNTSITKLPAEPTKTATAQYTYTFAGWKANGQWEPIPTASLPNVIWDVYYVASFISTVNKYDITFVDENGTTVLKTTTQYDYNTPAALIEQPATPTKSETSSHTYTFAGWDPALANVTQDQIYRATYTPIAKQYTVTLNPDGGVIEGAATTKIVTYGLPYWTLPTPTKVGYTFGGWFDVTDTQQQNEITEDTIVNTNANGQTLKAKWTVQHFNIRYLEEDRETPVIVPDSMIIYTVNDSIIIKNPTKEWYTFIGWKECVGSDCSTAYLKNGNSSITIPAWKTWDRDYLAIWNIHWHVVIWQDYNGVVLEIDPNVDFGDTPSYDVEDEDHNPKYPSREDTAEWDYEFIGWTDWEHTYGINDTLPTMGDADTTYTAVYSESKKKYTITFVDGETSISHQYYYGTSVEDLLEDAPLLSNPSDTECKTYTWVWTPELVEVTTGATYTANYTCTEKQKYTIEWRNYDGYLLWENEEYYGDVPFYDEEIHWTPEKDLNDGKVYKFIGWTPARTAVTWPETYVATYSDNPNTFVVTFDPKGWTVNPYRKPVTYGSWYGELPTPVKAGYTFDGWYNAEIQWNKVEAADIYEFTGNQTLYAYWNIVNYNIIYQNVPSGYTDPSTYTIEQSVNIPHPQKDGNKFLWWKEYVCNKIDVTQCSETDREHTRNILKEGDKTTLPVGTIWHRKYDAQREIIPYAVTWTNNGQLIYVDMVPYGTVPVYNVTQEHPLPTKAADDQYTYTFAGWNIWNTEYSTPLPPVEWPVTYSARFSTTTNSYTITFKNGNTVLQSGNVAYGVSPVYAGEIPTKASTLEHTYTFMWWTDGINEYSKDEILPTVTWEKIYTAIFEESTEKYTVTFIDYNGVVLKESTEYDYGTLVADIVKPTEPTRAWYTFAGWSGLPESTMPAENIIVTATYTINSYTVTFDTDWGSDVATETVNYNTAISRPGDPKKEGYTFSKWQKVEGETLSDYDFTTLVTDNITLKAIWTKNNYTVTYKDGNETMIIPWATTNYTITDEIIIPNPEKEGYTFVAWKEYVRTWENTRNFVKDILKDGESITIWTWNIWDREFRAQWRVNQYSVTFYDEDGEIVLWRKTVNYWEDVTYRSEAPKKAKTEQYTYEFLNWYNWTWSEAIVDNLKNITADRNVYARYSARVNRYDVIFYDEDGTTVLWSWEYEYGTPADAISKPSDPTKEDTAKWDYEFVSWSPEFKPVTWNQTYTATYSSTKQKYEVIFVDENWTTVLWSWEYEYGTDARLIERPENPIKETTDEYTYTFAWWTPTIVNVTTWATYTATYSGMANQYTVTLDLNEWEANPISIIVTYGQKYGELPIPERKWYEFTWWYTDPTAGIQITSWTTVDTWAKNQTLYAHWEINNYTVSYFDQDGTTELIIPLATTWYTINESITIPNPSKDEYTFIWWKEYVDWQYTKAYLSEWTWITIPAGNVWNIKYVAQWNKNWLSQWFVVLWIDWNDVILDMNTNIESWTSIANISKPDNPTRKADEGYKYTFANWTKNDIDVPDILAEIVTDNVKYKAKYNTIVNKYKVTFVDENGTVLKETKEYEYGTNFTLVDKPNNPTKVWYTFIWWKPEFPQRIPAEDLVFVAQWNKSWWNSSWWGWGGWGWWKSNNSQDKDDKVNTWTKNIDIHGTAWDEEDLNWWQDNIIEMSDNLDLSLYKWARKNSITTMDTIEEADSEWYLLRWHLAKILVNFSVNVLWREMPTETPKWCKRKDKDYEWDSDEIKFYSEKACAMWLMWLYVEEFMPNKIVDRAEFWTVVSRMLWWDTYNELDTYYHPYYEKHLKALQENGIMKDIDNPLWRREIRKRVWLVLKRIEQEKIWNKMKI